MRSSLGHVEPVLPVSGHVVSAERQHCERVVTKAANLAFGGGSLTKIEEPVAGVVIDISI